MAKNIDMALITTELNLNLIIIRVIIVNIKHTDVISSIGSHKALTFLKWGRSKTQPVKLSRLTIPATDRAIQIIRLKDMFLRTDSSAGIGSVSLSIMFIIYAIYIKCMNNKQKIKPGFPEPLN